MIERRGRQPRRGSIVTFMHTTAIDEEKERWGVVVQVDGDELDIIPGLSEPPEHGHAYVLSDIPPRSGLCRTTYFDLLDVNTAAAEAVEIRSQFPYRRFQELLGLLAELGAVKPESA